jgi:signal transduction histidine kinase
MIIGFRKIYAGDRFTLLLIVLLLSNSSYAQDTVIAITKNDFVFKEISAVVLARAPGWAYKRGMDVFPENSLPDSTGWTKFTENTKYFDLKSNKNYLGTWLRLKFKLDSSFSEKPVYIQIFSSTIFYLYLNDSLIGLHGERTGKGELKHKPASYRDHFIQTNIEPGKVYELKVFLVDDGKPGFLQSSTDGNFIIPDIALTGADAIDSGFINDQVQLFWQAVLIVLVLLFWLLYFLNKEEKVIALIALVVTLNFIGIFTGTDTFLSRYIMNDHYRIFLGAAFAYAWVASIPILVYYIFTNHIPRFLYVFMIAAFLLGILIPYFNLPEPLGLLAILVPATFTIYITVRSWKKIHGAQWIIIAGLLGTLAFLLLFAIIAIISGFFNSYSAMLLVYTGFVLTFPLSLLVFVAVRYRNLLVDTRRKAIENIRLAEENLKAELENKRILAEQNKFLETEVEKRTSELKESLDNLKATQSQLIQSEKMASLGELTAGIAHEIQNPLNFVNNFSEVNDELLKELKEAAEKGNLEDVKAIAKDIGFNSEKINHHGKRADAIVKGMLQHSRTSSGQKEPTDINELADEYLRLAYHGLRAKDKSFNAITKTEFDNSIGKIKVVPQDLGRVILNLINNAFYAVSEKAKQNIGGYEPTVTVGTAKQNGKVEIKVTDNGNGIPQKVLDKIFQPFFTTKPTGQGTGLGLSLSYDIVKAHGGELKLETKEGEESVFIIQLPVI